MKLRRNWRPCCGRSGKVRVVPDSRHHMPMDQPQAVIDAVLEVVAEARG